MSTALILSPDGQPRIHFYIIESEQDSSFVICLSTWKESVLFGLHFV